MTTWLTADWHLFHANVIRYCGRPFRSHEKMNQTLIERYCAAVAEDDTVYFLGDLTMRGPKQIRAIQSIVKQLPGSKHFIYGNHDRLRPQSYLRMGFLSAHTSLNLHIGGEVYHLVHDPIDASHGCRYVLCGHVHAAWKGFASPWTVNVGVDVWDFAPVRFSDVIRFANELAIGREDGDALYIESTRPDLFAHEAVPDWRAPRGRIRKLRRKHGPDVNFHLVSGKMPEPEKGVRKP